MCQVKDTSIFQHAYEIAVGYPFSFKHKQAIMTKERTESMIAPPTLEKLQEMQDAVCMR